MAVSKTRISVTIIHQLAQMLEEIAEADNVSKSEVVERSLKEMVEDRMKREAKIIASMTFDDLPSEEDWLIIQNETLQDD